MKHFLKKHTKEFLIGFTLMELMIAVAIIGIISAIAIPSYINYTRKARFSEVVQAATPFQVAVAECYHTTGSLDDCMGGKNGIPPDKDNGVGIVNSMKVSDKGIITVIPNNSKGISADETYVLTPQIDNNGTLTWRVSGGAVDAGLVSQ